MKKQNFCQVGTPVQFFLNVIRDKYIVCPAVISKVDGANVDIRFHRNDKQDSIVAHNVNHADFKKPWEDYWDYIPECHP